MEWIINTLESQYLQPIGDDTEPKWPMAPFNGEIHSQRDIERMVCSNFLFGAYVRKPLLDNDVKTCYILLRNLYTTHVQG